MADEAAAAAAAHAKFFRNRENRDILHLIHDPVKGLLPKLYRLENLDAQDHQRLTARLKDHAAESLREHLDPSRVRTASSVSDRVPTENERRAHWEAVKPQLKLGNNLTAKQRAELLAVLEKHCFTFSKDKGDIGLVRGYSHHIDTGDSKPIRLPPHRQSHAEKEEVAS